MLTITPQALTVIRRVTSHRSTTATAGVRIACPSDPTAPLKVRTVPGPQADDRVVERDGALLYLGRGTARRIAGRELDAKTRDDGQVQFVLRAAA